MHRLRISYLAAIGLACAAWLTGATLFHAHLSDRANRAQLQELTDQALVRAELAIDLVVITQSELIIGGYEKCNTYTVQQLRKAAYSVGTISDLYLLPKDELHCSAFSDLSAAPPTMEQLAEWPASRNRKIRLGKFAGAAGPVLGVAWRDADAVTLLAAIDADALVYDVLPTALRHDASIALRLLDGQAFARFVAAEGVPAISAMRARFESRSKRYPISAEIALEPSALASWRSEITMAEGAAVGLIGLLIGVLFAEATTRQRDPELKALDTALAKGEIVPHFQPIIDLGSGAVIGCEALARWIKPNGEQISPGRFIPIVERANRTDALATALIREAGRTLGPHLAERDAFRLAVNITAEQFLAPGFAGRFQSTVEKHGLRAGNMTIELTERQAMAHPEDAALVSTKLFEAGIRVAIDDAGTGHNGLAALQTLRAQTLKIDKYFVDGLPGDRRSRIMVDLMVSIAREFDMRTVAEGVETEAQAVALKRAGVNAAQGHLFSPAVAASAFIELLDQVYDTGAADDAAPGGPAPASIDRDAPTLPQDAPQEAHQEAHQDAAEVA